MTSTLNGLRNIAALAWQMIEKHYAKYIRNDADEQLGRLAGTVTQTVALPEQKRASGTEACGKGYVGPPGFEPGTNRL